MSLQTDLEFGTPAFEEAAERFIKLQDLKCISCSQEQEMLGLKTALADGVRKEVNDLLNTFVRREIDIEKAADEAKRCAVPLKRIEIDSFAQAGFQEARREVQDELMALLMLAELLRDPELAKLVKDAASSIRPQSIE